MSQFPSLSLKSHEYQELGQNESHKKTEVAFDDGVPNSTFSRLIRGLVKDTRSKIYGAACIGLALTIVVAIVISQSKLNHGESSPPHLCGNSTSEAQAAGCTWDQLMWAWYPPSCPHYANDDFLSADDWKFFSDPWGKEVTESEWEQGLNNELQLFSRHGEHLTHCLFFFLSVGQVLRDGTPATPKLRNYDHLHHCVKMLLPVVRGHANYSLINTKTPAVSYQEYC
ncbi:hypothetical protein F4819DRAFT_508687 [Hypoxylon fuscum]|nr:hypothetical protein F4819DRAFT_508687 [Hypoxylon fuscum]